MNPGRILRRSGKTLPMLSLFPAEEIVSHQTWQAYRTEMARLRLTSIRIWVFDSHVITPNCATLALAHPSSRIVQMTPMLASTVGEFGEAMADIGKQGTPVNVMRKTFSGISNMLNVASTMEAPSTPTASQLDDIFYGSETFTTVVDALVEAL
nr:uncharacterized protein LOC109158994 [Ipomoea batatas]